MEVVNLAVLACVLLRMTTKIRSPTFEEKVHPQKKILATPTASANVG